MITGRQVARVMLYGLVLFACSGLWFAFAILEIRDGSPWSGILYLCLAVLCAPGKSHLKPEVISKFLGEMLWLLSTIVLVGVYAGSIQYVFATTEAWIAVPATAALTVAALPGAVAICALHPEWRGIVRNGAIGARREPRKAASFALRACAAAGIVGFALGYAVENALNGFPAFETWADIVKAFPSILLTGVLFAGSFVLIRGLKLCEAAEPLFLSATLNAAREARARGVAHPDQ